MSTDRELIELAAKATGVADEIFWSETDQTYLYIELIDKEWNPLTDDGDALRLAVKLRIDLEFDSVRVFAFIPDDGGVRQRASEFYSEHNDCDAAAARRAITRAAAEIGRSMP